MIHYGRQSIGDEEIEAVSQVLKSDFLTQGPKVPEFESKISKAVDCVYSVAVNSGTSALHIACLALGLKAGDRLWTSPISFVASANCGLYCGAYVDFVDINESTNNLCSRALENKLKKAKVDKLLPDIVIPVHLAGFSCDMKKIYELSKEYGFKIIEDASHALGSEYLGSKVGSCKYSEITVFSFHPVKNITTAEGGVATTNSEELAELMNQYRTHGIVKDPKKIEKGIENPWYYEQVALGYNYRLSDIHAAIGVVQIEKLERFVKRRNDIAEFYRENLKGLPVSHPPIQKGYLSAYHLYLLRLDLNNSKLNQLELYNYCREKGVLLNLHYIPIYKQPWYKKKGYDILDFKNSEKYYKEALSLPIYPSLSKEEQKYVVEIIRKALL